MERRQLAWAISALVAFVFLSSYLGLLGRLFFWGDWKGVVALGFMQAVWTDSILADAAFVVGSVGGAVSCWLLAREHPWWAVGVGAFAHVLTYVTSFLLLGEVRGDLGEADLTESAVFVASWGVVGLVFASLAPPLARRWWLGREVDAGDAVPA